MDPEEFFDPVSGMTYRVRPAAMAARPGDVLLHGYGGDEKVLWVIELALVSGGVVAAPRGPFPASAGGYAWTAQDLGPGGHFEDFAPTFEPLSRWFETLEAKHGLVMAESFLAGFSQGSALAFALTALAGVRPRGLIALAAYLPEGDLTGLSGLPVFWGHGTHDERVPIERARRDVTRLRAAGAAVAYCESDAGHKVGMACVRSLREWLASPPN